MKWRLGGMLLLGLMAVAAMPVCAEEAGKFITVGAASEDITPDHPVMMGGYAGRNKPHEGVRTPIFTRVLYAQQGDEQFVWAESDLIAIEAEDAAVMRQKVSDATGVPADRVIISATHTHSGPAVADAFSCPKETDYLENYLTPRIIQAAGRAMETAEECTMTVVQGECSVAHDRRNDPVPGDGAAPNPDKAKAYVDTRVPAIAFKRADGSVKIVLLQYAMHPTSWGDQNIGAEWIGATAAAIKKEFGDNVEPFVLQGASGNIGSPCRQAPPDVLQSWGDAIAASVADLLRNEPPQETASLAVDSTIIPVEYDVFDEAAVKQTADEYRKTFSGQNRPDWIEFTVNPWEEKTLEMLAAGQTAEPAFIQAVVLGNHVFATSPFETFAQLNKYLCEKVSVPVHVVAYTNGNTNYLPTQEAFEQGGYETGSYIWFRRFPMKPGALEKLADDMVPLIQQTARKTGLAQ